jgi:hypothetical protein
MQTTGIRRTGYIDLISILHRMQEVRGIAYGLALTTWKWKPPIALASTRTHSWLEVAPHRIPSGNTKVS